MSKLKRVQILRQLRPYTRQLRGPIIGMLVILVLSIPASLISPQIFRILLDDVMGARDFGLFYVVVFGLLLVYAVRFVLDAFNLYFSNKINNRFVLRLRADVLNRLLHTPLANLANFDKGDIKMRLMDDVDAISNFIQDQVVDYCFSLLVMVVGVGIVANVSWLLSLICLVVIPPTLLIAHVIASATRKVNEEQRKVRQAYTTSTRNALQRWREIKTQNAQHIFVDTFVDFRTKLARLAERYMRLWGYLEVFNDFKNNYLTTVLVFIVGVFFLIRGQLSVGLLVMFSDYFGQVFGSIDALNQKRLSLITNYPYYTRVFETLELPQENNDAPAIDITGNVDVQDAHFSYDPDETLLQQICMRVRPGDRVAIIGETGCGKTTLAKLLLHLLLPQQGDISYEDINLNDFSPVNLYHQISAVMQDIYLFNMSIEDNLRLYKQDATKEEICDALRQANLLTTIDQLPDGLDTFIGEKGLRLSGGQKQRLAIAAALLRLPKVLYMDEATSSLDKISEDAINRAVLHMSATVISISHKPATILAANHIVVMDAGCIVASGTRDEVAAQNAYFAALLENEGDETH